MRRANSLLPVIVLFVGLIADGWSAPGRGASPEQLGYHRAQVSEEEALRLLVDRIAWGVQNHDPYLFAAFVSKDYQETFSESVISTRSQNHSEVSAAVGSMALLKAIGSWPTETVPASANLHTEITRVSAAEDQAVYALALHRDGRTAAQATLKFAKENGRWLLVGSEGLSGLASKYPAGAKRISGEAMAIGEEYSLLPVLGESPAPDQTFVARDLAPEYGVSTLSLKTTRDLLDRDLFSMPYGSALFARLQKFDTAPFFESVYVQMVTDRAWDRIVYGDYEKWVKSYDGSETGRLLSRPHGLAVDTDGTVYVADTGNGRIVILRLAGPSDDLRLRFVGVLGEADLSQPTEVALDDRGTVFDTTDDLLWIIDKGRNQLLAFGGLLSEPVKVVEYGGGEWVELSALAIGRFNGESDGNLYVADAGKRRIHWLYFDGEKVTEVGIYQAASDVTPTALATDHWGNLYVSDSGLRRIEKLSPALEPVAVLTAPDSTFQPLRFQTLFGVVKAPDAPSPTWSGYDQAFVVEKWTENSGGRRYELGIDFQVDRFGLSGDLSELVLTGRLTDPGHLRLELVSTRENGEIINLSDSWLNAGRFDLDWDRRNGAGKLIDPGYYRLRTLIESTYDRPAVVRETSDFYLPLYYYEDSGGPQARDPHLTRGRRVRDFGEEALRTVAVDPQEVVYTFHGLNRNVRYEARAAYFSGDGGTVEILYAGETALHDPVSVSDAVEHTDWLTVPGEAVRDGTLRLRIVKSGGSGKASVAAIWLRQADYDPQNPPVEESSGAVQLPREFVLNQNYPNPFNPTTVIEYSVPEGFQGHVTLRIYNMLGQTVRELVNGTVPAGVYRKVWNGVDSAGREVAAGVYFYRLRAGTFSQTRKLVLIK